MKKEIKISILLLVVTASLAMLEIIDHHDGKIFILVFALLIVAHVPVLLSARLSKWKIFSSRWFLPLTYSAFSLFSAAFIFRFWKFPLFDDAGFTLRYLDNFAKGHFYSFNVQDGPVFGVSSFSQGIICGILSWTHLFSPDKSILVTGFLGLVVISYFLLRILNHYGIKSELMVLSYILIFFGSKFFLNSMTTGMETPVHLAIVLAAIYFFITDNSKPMWLMFCASVISKLDAVPLALTLGIVHLWQHRKEFLPLSVKNKSLRELFFFVAIPLGLWIAFATVVFGSALPQSAYAKMFLHLHADDSRFPFLKHFLENSFRKPFFALFLSLFLWNVWVIIFGKKKVPVRTLAFGLSFFSTLVLYYFYNPIEQMIWYYAMPDFFLLGQIVISFALFAELEIGESLRPFIIYFSFIAASLILLNDVSGGRNWIKMYLTTTEDERIMVGKYLQSITTEKDSVIATHGHIARYTPAYVIDMTGLNSKFVTDNKNDLAVVASGTNPAFAVSHGTDYFIRTLDSLGYSLAKSYYDINEYYWPAWRVFSRKISAEEKTCIILPDTAQITARETRINFGMLICFGDTIEMKLPDGASLTEIRFGIKRISRLRSLIMNVVTGSDTLLTGKQFVAMEKDYKGKASHYTDEVVLKIDTLTAKIKNKKLVLTSSVKEELKIIEPVFLFHR